MGPYRLTKVPNAEKTDSDWAAENNMHWSPEAILGKDKSAIQFSGATSSDASHTARMVRVKCTFNRMLGQFS